MMAPAISQPAAAQTLLDTVSKTLAKHPQVASAKLDIDIAREDQAEQHSSYYPEVSVNTTFGRIFGDNSTSRGLSVTRGSGYSYLGEASISARQMIFDASETRNRLAAARADERAAILNVADVQENLALRAVQTYINLIRARKGLAMVEKHKSNVAGYLKRVKTLVDEGAADEAELQQARDVLLILQDYESDYMGQVKAAESDYKELTGDLPDKALTSPVPSLDMIPENLDESIALAMDNHPFLRSARITAESASHGIKAEESALYPDVDGELSFLKSDKDDVIGGELEDGRAVVRMNWNFETGGAQNARIQKRRLEYKAAISQLEDARRQIERGIRLAYAEKETAQRQFETQKKRYDLNKKLFSTYETQFEGARVSLLQVMQADNQKFNSSLEKTNAQHRFLLSQYAVLASIGKLQESLGLSPAPASDSMVANEQVEKP